jgi:hypothetical protein
MIRDTKVVVVYITGAQGGVRMRLQNMTVAGLVAVIAAVALAGSAALADPDGPDGTNEPVTMQPITESTDIGIMGTCSATYRAAVAGAQVCWTPSASGTGGTLRTCDPPPGDGQHVRAEYELNRNTTLRFGTYNYAGSDAGCVAQAISGISSIRFRAARFNGDTRNATSGWVTWNR